MLSIINLSLAGAGYGSCEQVAGTADPCRGAKDVCVIDDTSTIWCEVVRGLEKFK